MTEEVFLTQTEMDSNPQATLRLQTIQKGMRYDMNLYGFWIQRNSTAHSLANILGFRLEDPSKSWIHQPNPNHFGKISD